MFNKLLQYSKALVNNEKHRGVVIFRDKNHLKNGLNKFLVNIHKVLEGFNYRIVYALGKVTENGFA